MEDCLVGEEKRVKIVSIDFDFYKDFQSLQWNKKEILDFFRFVLCHFFDTIVTLFLVNDTVTNFLEMFSFMKEEEYFVRIKYKNC